MTPRRAAIGSSVLRWAARLQSRYAFPDRFRPKVGAGVQDWVWLRLPRFSAMGAAGPRAVHHWSQVRGSTDTVRERVSEVVRHELQRARLRPIAGTSPSPSAPSFTRTPNAGRPRVKVDAPPAVRFPPQRLELPLAKAQSAAMGAAPQPPTTGPAISRAASQDIIRELVTTPFLVAPPRPILSASPPPFLGSRSQHFVVVSPRDLRGLAPGRTGDAPARASSELPREHRGRGAGHVRDSTTAPAPAASARMPAPSALTPLRGVDHGLPARVPTSPSSGLLARRIRAKAADPMPPIRLSAMHADPPALSWPSPLAPATPAMSELHVARRSASPPELLGEAFAFRREVAATEGLPVVRRAAQGFHAGPEEGPGRTKGGAPAPDPERIRRQVEERVERTLVERMERLVARELSVDSAPFSRLSERVSAELSEALVLERERLGWS